MTCLWLKPVLEPGMGSSLLKPLEKFSLAGSHSQGSRDAAGRGQRHLTHQVQTPATEVTNSPQRKGQNPLGATAGEEHGGQQRKEGSSGWPLGRTA